MHKVRNNCARPISSWITGLTGFGSVRSMNHCWSVPVQIQSHRRNEERKDLQASGCDELLDTARTAASNDLFATQRRAIDSLTVVDQRPNVELHWVSPEDF